MDKKEFEALLQGIGSSVADLGARLEKLEGAQLTAEQRESLVAALAAKGVKKGKKVKSSGSFLDAFFDDDEEEPGDEE